MKRSRIVAALKPRKAEQMIPNLYREDGMRSATRYNR